MEEAIYNFIYTAYNRQHFQNKLILIKSYANNIMLIEVRHRKRPDALDEKKIKILLRNLLLTLYHYLHSYLINSTYSKEYFEGDPVSILVYELIKSSKPMKDFVSIVRKISFHLNNDYLYEFLRRAAIIEDFALKDIDFKGKLIDWDDVLSFDNLLARYHLPIKCNIQIELPLFETIQLPEKFIDFCKPPYNIDIFDCSTNKFIDLITGDVVYNNKDLLSLTQINIFEYSMKKYKGGLAIFLCLSGAEVSAIAYVCSFIDKYWYSIDDFGFYTDTFGDTDVGFRRGIITTLSKDKLDNVLDDFLSNNVLLNI